MNSFKGTEKFLHYDTKDAPFLGVNHNMYNARIQIEEAAALGRIPVLPRMRINAEHNFGSAQHRPYSDIASMEASYILESGAGEKKLRCLDEDEFDFNAFPEKSVKTINSGLVNAEDNARYPLIIRKMPSLAAFKSFTSIQPSKGNAILAVMTKHPPAKTIIDLAASVIEKLGDWHAQSFLHDLAHQSELNQKMSDRAYACLHIRSTHDGYNSADWLFAINPEPILVNCARARLPQGARCYIMSNIKNSAFFAPFSKRYRVFKATDFPKLKRLYPDGDSPGDNTTLFAVEQQIMSAATIRIFSHIRNQTSFALNR